MGGKSSKLRVYIILWFSYHFPTGNESSEETSCYSDASSGITTSSYSGAPYAHEVKILDPDRNLIEEWKDFHGYVEHYKFGSTSPFGHNGHVFRQPGTERVLKIHLLVHASNTWSIVIEKTEWKPEENIFKRSQHKWHAAKLIVAADGFSKEFGSWRLLFNNCRDFTSKLEEYLIKKEPYWSSTDMINDYLAFCRFAADKNFAIKLA